jgi:hypothetical protein
MSVFVNIVRYEKRKFAPITEADVKAAVKKLPGFKIVHDDESDAIAVSLPKTGMFAELESTGVLSCQYNRAPDGKQLLAALNKLAAKISGAVVEDEEGNVC